MDTKLSVPRRLSVPITRWTWQGAMKDRSINRVLYEQAMKREFSASTVEEVRIGLGYAAVALEGGRLGLAAVLRNETGPGCTVMKGAGTLAGGTASDLLELLVEGTTSLEKTLGLATANALFHPEPPLKEIDTLDLIALTGADRVAMVGFFGPLVKKIEATGAALSIIEMDSRRPGIHDGQDSRKALEEATVGLVTATSLLNGTLESTLDSLKSARHVTLLGPSTPLSPEAFRDTPVNHLAGAASTDNREVMKIISEGGGTPAMRPCLRFINLIRNEG